MVAVIMDGTAVLGLGDIRPDVGMPVMEGKCARFRAFGVVNREDISGPHCYEIEKHLKK